MPNMAKHHADKVRPTGNPLGSFISIVLGDQRIKFISWKQFHDLAKKCYFYHGWLVYVVEYINVLQTVVLQPATFFSLFWTDVS